MAATAAATAFVFVPANAMAADPPPKAEAGRAANAAMALPPQVAPKTEKTIYCLKTEVSGSLVRKKLCLTREQWAERGVDVTKE
jgi:hypothetical protein